MDIIEEVSTVTHALLGPPAVLLWIQTGCGACHQFTHQVYQPAALRWAQKVETQELPPIRFLVLDSAKPNGFVEAEEAEIKATPTVSFFVDQEEVREERLEGGEDVEAFTARIIRALFD